MQSRSCPSCSAITSSHPSARRVISQAAAEQRVRRVDADVDVELSPPTNIPRDFEVDSCFSPLEAIFAPSPVSSLLYAPPPIRPPLAPRPSSRCCCTSCCTQLHSSTQRPRPLHARCRATLITKPRTNRCIGSAFIITATPVVQDTLQVSLGESVHAELLGGELTVCLATPPSQLMDRPLPTTCDARNSLGGPRTLFEGIFAPPLSCPHRDSGQCPLLRMADSPPPLLCECVPCSTSRRVAS